MARHRYVKKRNRSKLAALVAAGVFTVTTASTATALAWPTTGAAASQANLASFTQSQAAVAAQQSRYAIALRTEQVTAKEAAQAAVKAATAEAAKQAAEQAAAAKRAAAAKAAAAAATRAAAAAAAAAAQKRQAAASTESSGTPQQVAAAMLGQFGWSSDQMSCLQPLWQQESRWEVTASNAGSGAYGIPQALPGSKMASAGSDWQTSAATQIKWGLEYIKNTYGSPCAAWNHEEADGWY